MFHAGHAAIPVAPHLLRYRVDHSVYGDIGTYSNRVEQSGDTTVVATSVRFRVSLLGIVFRREEAERTERWLGDRLVYFHGVTTINGHPSAVDGAAEGNSFVINSPLGVITAPAGVRPSNPWSANILTGTAMMRADTGLVEDVSIGAGKETTVELHGTRVPVEEYEIDGRTRYTVWLDKSGTPVMFKVYDKSGEVVFSLTD